MILPKGVSLRKGNLYLRRKIGGRDHYIRLPDLLHPDFEKAMVDAADELDRRRPDTKFTSPVNAANIRRWNRRAARRVRLEPLPPWLVLLAREARKRAARKGLPFDLTPDKLFELARRANGRCEITGLVFDHTRSAKGRWRPFAGSLDRISNADGYTYANVRLVCVCVNTALNQWGDEVFWEMIHAAAQRLGATAKNCGVNKVNDTYQKNG